MIHYGYIRTERYGGDHEIWCESEQRLAQAILTTGVLAWSTIEGIVDEDRQQLINVSAGNVGAYLPTYIRARHEVYRKVVREMIP